VNGVGLGQPAERKERNQGKTAVLVHQLPLARLEVEGDDKVNKRRVWPHQLCRNIDWHLNLAGEFKPVDLQLVPRCITD
jgi:hypothetical protein